MLSRGAAPSAVAGSSNAPCAVQHIKRRGAERRRLDRKAHPLLTFGNLLFVLGAVALLYVLAVFGALIYSSVLVF